jgi:hypothetical protein
MTVEIPIVQMTQRPERIDIGDGLVMRWSTIKDANNIADCMSVAFKVPFFSYIYLYTRYYFTTMSLSTQTYLFFLGEDKQAYVTTVYRIINFQRGSFYFPKKNSGLALVLLLLRMRILLPTHGSRLPL